LVLGLRETTEEKVPGFLPKKVQAQPHLDMNLLVVLFTDES
jgi:hypothetical protein